MDRSARSTRRQSPLRRVLDLVSVAVVLAVGAAMIGACARPAPAASPVEVLVHLSPAAPPVLDEGAAQVHLYEQAIALRGAGDTAGAVTALTRALEIRPAYVDALLLRAGIYLSMGRAEAALADAQAAIAADPSDAAVYVMLGEVLRLGFGSLEQAMDAYARAVALEPLLAEATFDARWRSAEAIGQTAVLDALASEYESSHPGDPLAAYYRGRVHLASGYARVAIDGLVDALESGGEELAALWFVLGDAYVVDGAWIEAKACYEQARTLVEGGDVTLNLISDAPVAVLFTGLGTAYLNLGECESARLMLRHALAVGPDRPELHTLLGQALICQLPTPTPIPLPTPHSVE